MAGLPPQLNAETGTPAEEWARSTTTAVFSSPKPAPGLAGDPSTDSTPGVELPGAFPQSPQHSQGQDRPSTTEMGGTTASDATTGTEKGTGYDLGDAANRAMKTMSTTAQSAASTVASTAQSAAQHIASYMQPAEMPGATVRASEHDQAHKTSMPSSETMGAGEHEHIGGAGSLPGSVTEEAVSELPDERAQEAMADVGTMQKPESMDIAGTYPSPTYPPMEAGAVASGLSASSTSAAPTKSNAPEETSIPSQELEGAKPYEHQAGAGALPGKMREEGVAELPDETRAREGLEAMPSQEETRKDMREPSASVAGVGALPGMRGEEEVATLPEEGERKQAPEEMGEQLKDQPSGVTGATGQVKDDAEKTTETVKKDVPSVEKEGKADVLHPNLKPRVYMLGSPYAQWHGTSVGVLYKEGIGVDVEYTESQGYGTDYHPAQMHPDTHKGTGAGYNRASSASEAPKQQETTGAAPREKSVEKTKKVGFMDKMKGEAKILLGKVEGKKGHDKVEEGKRMKAGEA